MIDHDKTKVKDLHIGKIQTVTIQVEKYNFPRIRNLPNKVVCSDDTGKIECVFFNSYEGYIRKILPLNTYVTISGKIGFFKGRYQITNPSHLSNDQNKIKKYIQVIVLQKELQTMCSTKLLTKS